MTMQIYIKKCERRQRQRIFLQRYYLETTKTTTNNSEDGCKKDVAGCDSCFYDIRGGLEPKVTVFEERESKNSNKFVFSLVLHYLCKIIQIATSIRTLFYGRAQGSSPTTNHYY